MAQLGYQTKAAPQWQHQMPPCCTYWFRLLALETHMTVTDTRGPTYVTVTQILRDILLYRITGAHT